MPTLIKAPQGVHSGKPEIFAEYIERLYPNTPKLEIFARGEPRPGWHSWGNEASSSAQVSERPKAPAHWVENVDAHDKTQGIIGGVPPKWRPQTREQKLT